MLPFWRMHIKISKQCSLLTSHYQGTCKFQMKGIVPKIEAHCTLHGQIVSTIVALSFSLCQLEVWHITKRHTWTRIKATDTHQLIQSSRKGHPNWGHNIVWTDVSRSHQNLVIFYFNVILLINFLYNSWGLVNDLIKTWRVQYILDMLISELQHLTHKICCLISCMFMKQEHAQIWNRHW
jgi:hypothetical protein